MPRIQPNDAFVGTAQASYELQPDCALTVPFWSTKKHVLAALDEVGVGITSRQPCRIWVRDERFYSRVLRDSFMGLAESYVEGWWDCEGAAIDDLCHRLIRGGLWKDRSPFSKLALSVFDGVINRQSQSRAREVCEVHYNLGNDLYRSMLDPTMAYTCGYWNDARTLEEAQLAKMDLVCRKLGLERGMRILDIGCGWGSFMKFAAENYGVECVGYSLSHAQVQFGRDFCAGLPVEFVEADYRNICGKYDRIASIGMFEAVGSRNFRTYMEVVERSLADGGIMLLHTMGGHTTKARCEPWFDKYIFPNGLIPSVAQIGDSIDGLLAINDWHCFGANYDLTLMAWNSNFQASWPQLKARYSDRFKRMWEFYLLSLAGGFRAGHMDLWQIVLTRPGQSAPLSRKT